MCDLWVWLSTTSLEASLAASERGSIWRRLMESIGRRRWIQQSNIRRIRGSFGQTKPEAARAYSLDDVAAIGSDALLDSLVSRLDAGSMLAWRAVGASHTRGVATDNMWREFCLMKLMTSADFFLARTTKVQYNVICHPNPHLRQFLGSGLDLKP